MSVSHRQPTNGQLRLHIFALRSNGSLTRIESLVFPHCPYPFHGDFSNGAAAEYPESVNRLEKDRWSLEEGGPRVPLGYVCNQFRNVFLVIQRVPATVLVLCLDHSQ
jgi:hypothetical protein